MSAWLRVCDVLKRPPFQSALLAAGQGGLSRPIRWVHILDVPNARGHIHGGELVLTTGLGFGKHPYQFQSFIEELIEGQAAALCIELGTAIRELPTAIRRLADANNFPVLLFPKHVRFVDITQDLHKQILIHERQALSEQTWVETVISGQTVWDTEPLAAAMLPTRWFCVAVLALDELVASRAANPSVALEVSEQHRHTESDWMQLTASAWRDVIPFIRPAFRAEGLRTHLAMRQEEVIAVLEFSDPERDWVSVLNTGFSAVQSACSECLGAPAATALHMGVGRPVNGLAQVPNSYQDARKALLISRRVPGRRWWMYDEAGVFRWLTLLAGSQAAAELAARDLDELAAYDRRHGTQLLQTLRVYLDCDRSKQRTAAALYIHRQTLYHRLEQMEAILRSNLDDPVQRLSLHLSVYYRTFFQHQPH